MQDLHTGTITRIERLNCSVNGNPRYAITLEFIGLGAWEQTFVTSSDHAFCYEVGNPGLRVGCAVEVLLTRAGRIWICGMRSLENIEG
jgi:hypothetical protein